MIIRRDHETLLVITQGDHAALAGEIMAAWRADGLPAHPRRDTILLAMREHDNGWRDEDAATHVDEAGDPLDFMSVPPAVKQRIWPPAALRVAERDPYAGALVAAHAETVYGQQRSDPDWRGFIEAMARLKADLLARCAGLDAQTLAADYRFVQTGDQLSLIFCNGWTAPFPRPGGRTILNGTTLEIAPDPFEGATLPLRLRARRLAARTFGSRGELRNALAAAPVEWIEGSARGAAFTRDDHH